MRRRRHSKKYHRKKRSQFSKLSRKSRNHPIATGVILIIASFILFRLSANMNGSEATFWVILLSIGLFIAGVLVLIGWWRNHISMFTTRHNVNWKNR